MFYLLFHFLTSCDRSDWWIDWILCGWSQTRWLSCKDYLAYDAYVLYIFWGKTSILFRKTIQVGIFCGPINSDLNTRLSFSEIFLLRIFCEYISSINRKCSNNFFLKIWFTTFKSSIILSIPIEYCFCMLGSVDEAKINSYRTFTCTN